MVKHVVHMRVISSIPDNVLRAWVDAAREEIIEKAKKLNQPIEIQNWQE